MGKIFIAIFIATFLFDCTAQAQRSRSGSTTHAPAKLDPAAQKKLLEEQLREKQPKVDPAAQETLLEKLADSSEPITVENTVEEYLSEIKCIYYSV